MLTRAEVLMFEKRFRVLKSLIEKEAKQKPFYYTMDRIAEGIINGQVGHATFTITPYTQWETLSVYIKKSLSIEGDSAKCVKCGQKEYLLIMQCLDCMVMMCQNCHFQNKDMNHRVCMLCGTMRGSKGELISKNKPIGCEREHITNESEPSPCKSKRGMRKRRRRR